MIEANSPHPNPSVPAKAPYLSVLGRRRGRPRKVEPGHSPGTVQSERRVNSGQNGSALAALTVAPVVPRLLNLANAAAYLSISEWSVRDLEAAGTLPRVRIPIGPHGELRKLLFDREDLDRCIETWKDHGAHAALK